MFAKLFRNINMFIRDISSDILIAVKQLTRPLILLHCQIADRAKCFYNWARIEWLRALTIRALMIYVKLHVQSSGYYYALLRRANCT